MTQAIERARVVACARSWLGTPFHHAARLKGVGVDCAQFLIAVYTELALVDAPEVEFYTPDWFLHEDRERLLDWITHYCVPIDTPAPGDLALFRYGRAVSHGGIVTGPHTIIHSFRGVGVVLESFAASHALAARLAGFWTLRRWAMDSLEHTIEEPT